MGPGDKKGKVIDLRHAFAERAAQNDAVVQLSVKVLDVLAAAGCSPAECLAALGLSGKAIRGMLETHCTPEEVNAVTDQAMALTRQYTINLQPEDKG